VSECPLFNDARNAAPPRAPEAPPSPPAAREVMQLRGLCVNCEHRLTCAHALRTGGVWHCENYE
jgi:hypothetical protein